MLKLRPFGIMTFFAPDREDTEASLCAFPGGILTVKIEPASNR